ncbi:MAG: RsmB/NOP family class I SAM-dependent RNA methyltransferase [Firmicutes bacterium]|nr:RsmB/NOP family class I SAM-dependent RNA methyltransferase [Bacillota bacterium]
MKSFKQLYQRLPPELTATLSAQYQPRIYERILSGFMVERPVTLRVNRLKTDIRRVMEIFRGQNFKHQRVDWYEDALIIQNKREKGFETHPLFQKGHIYLQSLSSMIPPLVLNPKPGMKILDLTAAPGSKTTQLAALMNNEGYLLANELNPIRAERLKFNIERQGATIVEVRVGDGKRPDPNWTGFFDGVLLDAPCSGVGLIAVANSQTYRGWSLKTVNKLVKEQRKLFATAFQALKPGGLLVYSTCTLMNEENEGIINWALERYPTQITPEKIDLVIPNATTQPAPYNNQNNSGLIIIPSELYEGFFITKLRKG